MFLNKPPCNAQGSNLDGEIIAFHAIGGHIKWRRTIGPSETSPLVSNGLVYAGDWNGKVYAFDTATGKTLDIRDRRQGKGDVAVDGNRSTSAGPTVTSTR